MGPRPWKPADELEVALERGNLRYAIGLAEEVRGERRKPIPLETASRFLPLIARESPREYDAWALRWLARWMAEAGASTIERTAEVAALLADLPRDPDAIHGLQAAISRACPARGAPTRATAAGRAGRSRPAGRP